MPRHPISAAAYVARLQRNASEYLDGCKSRAAFDAEGIALWDAIAKRPRLHAMVLAALRATMSTSLAPTTHECPFCPDAILPHEDFAVDNKKRVCHAECLAEAKRQAADIAADDAADYERFAS